MKPYESWDEFGQFLKHAGSLVNFVAAYGTHASIIGATTLLDKRAAALALVENAVDRQRHLRPGRLRLHAQPGCVRQRRRQSARGARAMEHRLDHRPRHGRSVDRRPGREAEPVRRPAGLDLQLHLREPDGGHPGRRPSLLSAAHRRHALRHRDRGQHVRPADHAEHRHASSECQHLPDAGIRGRGRHRHRSTRRPGCATPSPARCWSRC